VNVRKRSLPSGWYPDTAAGCRKDIEEFLTGFTPPEGDRIGGVAPHAGWFFSGRAAARVIKTLSLGPAVDRVVLYGGHLSAAAEPIAYTEDAWETPPGPLPLDASFTRALISSGAAVEAGPVYADNTVEVQLPFVRSFFEDTPVIAVHSPAGAGALRLASAVIEALAERGLKAVFIGSSDLTHYGPNYGWSPEGTGPRAVEWVRNENDRSIIEKAVAMDAQGVLEDQRTRKNTCSSGPIASVIESVSALGRGKGELLEYYTSYDVMPGSSFVGYAAIVY
jgi:AmmeMemoRadiSam system protein B